MTTRPGSHPALAGLLGEHPLPRLLVFALDRRLRGRLVLTERDWTEHVISLSRGGIAGVESKIDAPSVGRTLVERGAIDEALYARTTGALGGEDDGYGDQLVAAGTIRPADLQAARAERIAKVVARLIATLHASTAFSMLVDEDDGKAVSAVDPLPVIWEGVALRGGLDAHTDEAVNGLVSRPIVLQSAAPIARFRFGEREAAAIEWLSRARLPLRRLVTDPGGPSMSEDEWRMLVGVLLVTRCLDVGDGATPAGVVGPAEPPPSAATRSLAPGPAAPREGPAPEAAHEAHAREGLWARFKYLLFGLALAPLALSIGADKLDIPNRLRRTVEANPDVFAQLKAREASDDEIFAAIPGHKLVGAHLAHDSYVHWIYAAVAAAAMLGVVLFLFEREKARIQNLLLTGLFTGTAGILLLLGLQWVAEYTQHVWIRGTGIATVLFYVVKFIGFSYRAALDPENGFAESLLGFTFGVGLCEELIKALPIVWRFRRPSEIGWRDAAVWGLASGIGFGVAEGIQYASSYYNGIATSGIYVVRFVSCVALHAVWSGAVAMTVHERQEIVHGSHRWYEWIFGMLRLVAVPMVLHGLYDTLLKRDFEAPALGVAALSFGWLAWKVARARKFEADWESAARADINAR